MGDKKTVEEGCPAACQCGSVSESRRTMLRRLGWGAFFTTLGISTAGGLRFLFPRVLFEPPSTFKIGTLDDYPSGDGDDGDDADGGGSDDDESCMTKIGIWIAAGRRRGA